MKQIETWMAMVTIAAALGLTACQRHEAAHTAEHPAHVEKIEGTEISKVTLTPRAIERLDLRTDEVREQRLPDSGSAQKVVPYSSLIYDPQGRTWVYTSPEKGTFVRHEVQVDHIEGDVVALKDGPPAGTVVASMAVAELYGTEFKVGH